MCKKLNIVMVTVADLPEGGGNTSRLKSLVSALSQSGHKVSVLNQHSLGISSEKTQQSAGEISGAPYRYVLGTVNKKAGFALMIDKIKAVYSIHRHIRGLQKDGNIDVLWFNCLSFYDTFPLSLLARRLFIPTIQSYEDERLEQVANGRISLSRRLYAFNSWLADRTCPNLADAIVVISSYLKEKYKALGQYPERIHLIPTLINTQEWECPDEKDALVPTLLYSGVFGEQDEIEKLIEAFSLLLRSGHQFKVVMLGSNERDPTRVSRAAALIEKFELSSVVSMVGFVPLEEVKKHIASANILLNIRRGGVWANSGLSTKMSEYLASGRMVIASTVGDVRTYLENGKNAILVSPNAEVEDIYKAIAQGLDSFEFRKKIGSQGKESAKNHFEISIVSKKIQLILNEVTP